MINIFVNLKRFDVPRSIGGVCPVNDPEQWINDVITDSVESGLGMINNVNLTYLLPESLIISANRCKNSFKNNSIKNLFIGCQGVFRENIEKGKNFGAFTTNLPAAAAYNLGCSWSIIGHSEERKDKFDFLVEFSKENNFDDILKINEFIHRIINKEVIEAFKSGLNVLLCVGETVEERGDGTFDEQKSNIEQVLKNQLELGLKNTAQFLSDQEIVIGYEPRWAIGPGKIPPNAEYIGYVSEIIKKWMLKLFNYNPLVVYGGGLKEKNAAEIAGIKSINGGLVALTKFTGNIGFEVKGLKRIIDKYLEEVKEEVK